MYVAVFYSVTGHSIFKCEGSCNITARPLNSPVCTCHLVLFTLPTFVQLFVLSTQSPLGNVAINYRAACSRKLSHVVLTLHESFIGTLDYMRFVVHTEK